MISTLKAAFVQGRLDRDELEARTAAALTSRTYADLAALTADLPAGLADAAPPRRAAGATARRPMSTAARAAIFLVLAVTAPAILPFPAGRGMFLLLTPFYCMALAVLGAETLVSWNDRRFRRRPQPPGSYRPAGRSSVSRVAGSGGAGAPGSAAMARSRRRKPVSSSSGVR